MEPQRYFQQPNVGNGIIWVQGGEVGAKSYPVAPGNSVAIFDADSERFFIKSVDISGMPQPLREFTYKEVIRKPEQPVEDCKYATKEDLDYFQEAVLSKVDDLMHKYLSNKKNYNNKEKGESQ